VQVLPVGVFSPREAMKYLMERLSADPDQRHGAMGLAAELGHQPLALAQASAAIATSMLSCADYQDHFTRLRAQFAGQASGEQPPAAEVTWRLSAEQAERLSPGGAPQLILALTALLGGDAIPGTVFTTPASCEYLATAGAPAAAGPDHAWDGVLALERAGLLAIGPAGAPKVAWMNGAVAAGVRAATPEEMAGQAVRAAADALAETWPEREPQAWLASGLRSCAASLQASAGDTLWAAHQCHPLLVRAGRSLDSARLTGPAAAHWAQLAATSDRLFGPDSPATLAAGSHLARALLTAGHSAQAVAWAKWALSGQTRTHGPTHPATLAACLAFGHALAAAGRPNQAITVLGEVAAEYERLHGPGHPDTLGARDDLAATCQAAGQHAQAISYYQRTLTDREHLAGSDHLETITARENLARACLAGQRFEEAIAHYHQALTARQAVLGAEHPDTIAARATIATANHAAGKIPAALALSEQVRTDYQRVLGPAHPHTLTHQASLARAYHAAGRLTDAATLLRDTLTRAQQSLPPEHPLIQTLQDDLTGIAGG
jgi:tetratricopeptide (TPR) repeat protein